MMSSSRSAFLLRSTMDPPWSLRIEDEAPLMDPTLVPAPALGMGAETLLTVRVAPSRMDEVARELAKYSSVRYLAATLDENALFCEVITRSSDDLYEFITSTLSALDGVEGWTASMELLFLKRGFAETPWWRAQLGTPGTP